MLCILISMRVGCELKNAHFCLIIKVWMRPSLFHKRGLCLTWSLSHTNLPCRLCPWAVERDGEMDEHAGDETQADERGTESMRMERLIASCEEQIERWRGRLKKEVKLAGKWWWEVEGRGGKVELFISPSSSQSFPLLSPHRSIGQLTTQWESNYHLSTGEERATPPTPASCPLPPYLSSISCPPSPGHETLPPTGCEWKRSRRSQMTEGILMR